MSLRFVAINTNNYIVKSINCTYLPPLKVWRRLTFACYLKKKLLVEFSISVVLLIFALEDHGYKMQCWHLLFPMTSVGDHVLHNDKKRYVLLRRMVPL